VPEQPPRTPSADDIAASVAERVRRILAGAHEAAAGIRRVAEEEATATRAEAEHEAAAYLEAARRRIDAFADGRIRRIRQASDDLLTGAEDLRSGLRRTDRLAAGIEDVVDALAAAAEAVAAEAGRTPIRLPRIEGGGVAAMTPQPLPAQPPTAGVGAGAGRENAGTPPPPAPPDAPDAQVRDIASRLPPRPGSRRPVPPPVVPPDDAA
jgi:hypothetical protein